MIQETVFIGSS